MNARFRKKPVVVEAMQYPGMRELAEARPVLEWLDSHGVQHRHDGGLIIRTLEGEHLASPGDWIIRGRSRASSTRASPTSSRRRMNL
jgi:hypothetical protein